MGYMLHAVTFKPDVIIFYRPRATDNLSYRFAGRNVINEDY